MLLYLSVFLSTDNEFDNKNYFQFPSGTPQQFILTTIWG